MADHPIDPRDDEPYGEPLRNRTTTSGKPPEPGTEGTGAPGKIDPATGMYTQYWVLSEEERRKGFVEPLRVAYRHVGIEGPTNPLRDLTKAENDRYADVGYVKYEQYPENDPSAAVGRFWSQEQLDKVGKGCGAITSMGTALCETYARQPEFYGSTFCATCCTHLPVGKDGEFVWLDTTQRVGTRTPNQRVSPTSEEAQKVK